MYKCKCVKCVQCTQCKQGRQSRKKGLSGKRGNFLFSILFVGMENGIELGIEKGKLLSAQHLLRAKPSLGGQFPK